MKICIFGASSDYIDKKYSDSAYNLASEMAKRGHSLVFGGGGSGVMGASARGFYDNNAHILGVAPKFMTQYNIFFENCTEFKLTETMAERKAYMEEMADCFVIAPGGIGTYEEFFEVYTLKQLGRHSKAIVIFNPYGYYDKMLDMLRHTISEKFLEESSIKLISVFDDADKLIEYLENYKPTETNVIETRYGFKKDKKDDNK